MHGDFPTMVGSIGVGLLLAYFLNLIKLFVVPPSGGQA